MVRILIYILLSVKGIRAVEEVDIEEVRAVEEVDVKGVHAVKEVGVDDDELIS